MTDENVTTNAAAQRANAAAVAAPKAKTVADNMDSRRVFNSTEDALNYLNLCSESFSDFTDIPLASVGLIIDDDGVTFDPEIYTDSMRVMVSTLRSQKGAEATGGIKAIVVAPIPTLDAMLGDDSGKSWLLKIIDKEFNHVAVRALRDASDVSTVVDQMPSTRDAYISSSREGASGIIESYNELFKDLNRILSAKVNVWAKARLTKNELKRALESKGYAAEYYPALENRKSGSLFVAALDLAVSAAKLKGFDPTIFERWAETRDGKAFTSDEDEDAVDLGDLGDLLSEAKDSAPAEDAAA